MKLECSICLSEKWNCLIQEQTKKILKLYLPNSPLAKKCDLFWTILISMRSQSNGWSLFYKNYHYEITMNTYQAKMIYYSICCCMRKIRRSCPFYIFFINVNLASVKIMRPRVIHLLVSFSKRVVNVFTLKIKCHSNVPSNFEKTAVIKCSISNKKKTRIHDHVFDS